MLYRAGEGCAGRKVVDADCLEGDMDTSNLVIAALSTLSRTVKETECFARTCRDLVRDRGEAAPPWVFSVEQHVERLRQATSVLEVALRHRGLACPRDGASQPAAIELPCQVNTPSAKPGAIDCEPHKAAGTGR